MRAAGAAILLLALGGCMSAPKPACPAGQSQLRTAQLFLSAKPPAKITDADIRRFVDAEVTPRFPAGVTVVDGGGQWRGDENRLIREAAKVVMIVLPERGDPASKVEAVRAAYRAKFKQDSMVVLPPPACVAL
jgi:CubicO group peptidase (beta-lactamase class C family)